MGKPVVLCVDDDLDGLIGREALLRQNGYNVLISTSPREGLRLFSSCHIDAVVLDYAMPEMCGDALATHEAHQAGRSADVVERGRPFG
jgi:CheY-like chemotaxis protein